MTENAIAPSLELEQDPRVHRREWRFERAGWISLLLLMLAASAGAFGDGPLSRTERRSPDGRSQLEYERVVRFGTPTTVTLIQAAAGAEDTMAVVRLDRRFADALDVERVSPEPLETRATAEFVEHHFRLAHPGAVVRVEIRGSPTKLWRQSARVQTASGPLDIQLLVLP